MTYPRCLCTLLLLGTAAGAQAGGDAFDQCAQQSDPVQRLACFDQANVRRHGAAAQAPTASAPARPAASNTDPNEGLEGAQLRKRQREQGILKPGPQPISASILRTNQHPDHEYTFYLDNGQVWEQAESSPGLYVHDHAPVVITAGSLGSFFMQVSPSRTVRVRRVL